MSFYLERSWVALSTFAPGLMSATSKTGKQIQAVKALRFQLWWLVVLDLEEQ